MQIPDNLVEYITAELIKRLGNAALAVTPARPTLCLVGSRRDLSAPALAALEEQYEITEQADWDHSAPADTAVLFTAPFLARSGLKIIRERTATPAPQAHSVVAATGKRPLLTESELMKLCPASCGEGQELCLPTGTVITPLAKDYIRAMKIRLM